MAPTCTGAGWSCRMMSCQKSTCRRTKPGTNRSPSPIASHTGASHGIRRRGPCMGSRATSATDGNRPGTAGSAPERTHTRSTAPSGGAGRIRGRTQAWRLSRRWSHPSAPTYGTTWRKKAGGGVYGYTKSLLYTCRNIPADEGAAICWVSKTNRRADAGNRPLASLRIA